MPRTPRGAATISDSPIPDNPNWHRHRNWCPHYRERWSIGQEPDGQGGKLLYQIICLQNTPPETEEEQSWCMTMRTTCWRLQTARRSRKRTEADPAETAATPA